MSDISIMYHLLGQVVINIFLYCTVFCPQQSLYLLDKLPSSLNESHWEEATRQDSPHYGMVSCYRTKHRPTADSSKSIIANKDHLS